MLHGTATSSGSLMTKTCGISQLALRLNWWQQTWTMWLAERWVIADWKKKDKKARKEICLHISDKHLVYIDQFMGRNDIWTRLQDIFKSKGVVRSINLHQEFFCTFTEDGANMEEHFCKLWGLSCCDKIIMKSFLSSYTKKRTKNKKEHQRWPHHDAYTVCHTWHNKLMWWCLI